MSDDGARILVVDDEPQILRALRVVLGNEGFRAVPAATVAEALDLVAVDPPDAAIVDLVLPDGDGVVICERIREWSEMPIVVLSAIGDEAEKVRALNAGADDYVTKPFGSGELLARLRAALRRAPGGGDGARVEADGLVVDLAARRVLRDGDEVHLTPTEFELLRTLAAHRGRLLTHTMLLSEVWGPAYAEDTHVLRVHIANLRRKIEPEPSRPRYITTDQGVGYRFAA
jgi:two-component system KDP operon response regulator KdpE